MPNKPKTSLAQQSNYLRSESGIGLESTLTYFCFLPPRRPCLTLTTSSPPMPSPQPNPSSATGEAGVLGSCLPSALPYHCRGKLGNAPAPGPKQLGTWNDAIFFILGTITFLQCKNLP
jgi:hypothetical protein